MRLTNWMVEKVGADKLLHFLVAAWVVAECKCWGVVPMVIGFLVISLLAVAKELWLDDHADIKDAVWSVLGGGVSVLLYLISMVL